jgi:pimeloyl-ACP methyl ester carboxylesterase
MRRSVDWMRAGLPSEHIWEELFNQVMVHGKTTSQVFPRVYTGEELAQIKAPTLLILGDHEKIYPVDEASRAAKKLMPPIRVKIIPDAHHITALANPEVVNATLLEFFRES